MSATLLDSSPNPLSPPPRKPSNEDVLVRLDELIIGRDLQFPIHDDEGRLLLNAGVQITPEFKSLLRRRDLRNVRINSSDVARVTLRGVSLAESKEPSASLMAAVSGQLDQLINSSGALFVSNAGPAVKKSVVSHGCRGYQSTKIDELQQKRGAAVAQVGQMMQEALVGAINATSVVAVAGQFLADLSEDADGVMAVALDASREADLSEHCLQMALLGMALGVEMDLDASNCQRIALAGLVHDWGQVRLPEPLRNSSHELTPAELFEYRKHPIYTAELLSRMPGMPSMVQVISYQVHERPSGTGYPRGRLEHRIHTFARILRVADVYVRLCRPTAWRDALAPYASMEAILRFAAHRELDPEAARALLHLLSLFPIGSWVTLSDGRVGQVIRRNHNHYAQPIVQVFSDGSETFEEPLIVDLVAENLKVQQALPTPGRIETLLSEDLFQRIRRQD